MKEYVKFKVTFWERLLFLFMGILPKDILNINTTVTTKIPITEGNMLGGNGCIKQPTNQTRPTFKPPAPKPFFDDCDDDIEVNL